MVFGSYHLAKLAPPRQTWAGPSGLFWRRHWFFGVIICFQADPLDGRRGAHYHEAVLQTARPVRSGPFRGDIRLLQSPSILWHQLPNAAAKQGFKGQVPKKANPPPPHKRLLIDIFVIVHRDNRGGEEGALFSEL